MNTLGFKMIRNERCSRERNLDLLRERKRSLIRQEGILVHPRFQLKARLRQGLLCAFSDEGVEEVVFGEGSTGFFGSVRDSGNESFVLEEAEADFVSDFVGYLGGGDAFLGEAIDYHA